MKTKPPFDGEIHAVSAKNMPDLINPKREPGWFLGEPTPTRDEAVRDRIAGPTVAVPLKIVERIRAYRASQPYDPMLSQIEIDMNIALASAPAPASGGVDAVRVKALEWREEEPDWWSAEALTWKSGYEAWKSPSGVVRWRVPGDAKFSLFDGTLEEAKAACEAAYDKLIRSALSPAATPVSEAGGEAAKSAWRKWNETYDPSKDMMFEGAAQRGFLAGWSAANLYRDTENANERH